MTLTTPSRVRERLSISEYQASDAIINDFIASAEGEITFRLDGRVPVSGDDDYEFACAVATGMAALSTGLQLPYPENSAEAQAWADKLRMIRGKNSSDMVNLTTNLFQDVAMPRSTTVD